MTANGVWRFRNRTVDFARPTPQVDTALEAIAPPWQPGDRLCGITTGALLCPEGVRNAHSCSTRLS